MLRGGWGVESQRIHLHDSEVAVQHSVARGGGAAQLRQQLPRMRESPQAGPSTQTILTRMTAAV